jgi:hypothetical protein
MCCTTIDITIQASRASEFSMAMIEIRNKIYSFAKQCNYRLQYTKKAAAALCYGCIAEAMAGNVRLIPIFWPTVPVPLSVAAKDNRLVP